MYVSTAGEKGRLLPLYKLGLEQAIECIDNDESLGVTLQCLYIRKRILVANIHPKPQE